MTITRLIYVDLTGNSNKYWNGKIEGSDFVSEWGRVGDFPQSKRFKCGNEFTALQMLERKKREKLRKGYTEQKTIHEGSETKAISNIAYIAKVQIEHSNDKETEALIDFLVQRNIHAIEGMTSIKFNNNRQATTPLGPVTLEGLEEAEKLLALMSKSSKNLAINANNYLRIVPRTLSRTRTDPVDLFGSKEKIQNELIILDSLRAVVKDSVQKSSTDIPVFETKLKLVSSGESDYKHLDKLFYDSKNNKHTSSNMRLQKVWKMSINAMDQGFEYKLGNIKELWHGTKDANLLSILKNGFIIPKRNSGIAIAGRMYGDGVYFSDQSTKSLNYASGFWGGQASNRCFMLMNDVAMGKEYIATRSISTLPAGYDSCFAKGGTAVRNNEMIVYRTSQVKPRYLCEFA